MFAGAISMAAGTYLSTKSQKEFYESELAREKREMEELPEIEAQKIRDIYKEKGFGGKELELVVKRITFNKDIWLKVMMEEELGLHGRFENPVRSMLVMGLAFFVGALVPISSYLFWMWQQHSNLRS